MKYLITVLIVLSLGGCSTYAQKAAEKGAEKGAEANDAALRVAIFTICRGASIGSIRRFFDTTEKTQAWQALCGNEDAFTLGGNSQ